MIQEFVHKISVSKFDSIQFNAHNDSKNYLLNECSACGESMRYHERGLRFCFDLKSGTYATIFLRELFG